METWNRLTAVGGEVGGGISGRKGKGLVREHIWMIMDVDNGEGIDCGREGGLGRGGQRGKIGTTVIE